MILDAQERYARNQIGLFDRRIDKELELYPKQARQAGFIQVVDDEDDEL